MRGVDQLMIQAVPSENLISATCGDSADAIADHVLRDDEAAALDCARIRRILREHQHLRLVVPSKTSFRLASAIAAMQAAQHRK
jgi:hypothetical protein